MKARIIAIANNKGGVGKTALATNLGAAFARRGLKTLLVDFDSQANLTDAYLDAKKVSTFAAEAIRKGKPLPTIAIRENLFIAPSDRSTGDLGEDTPEKLQASLKPLLSEFDYIIIDTPPTIGLLTISALLNAQELIVPLTAEPSALKGLSEMNRLKDRVQRQGSKLRLLAVVLTLYEGRRSLSKLITDVAEQSYSDLLCKNTIRKNVAVAEASLERTDVLSYNKRCNAAADYENLADEILSRLQA